MVDFKGMVIEKGEEYGAETFVDAWKWKIFQDGGMVGGGGKRNEPPFFCDSMNMERWGKRRG